MVKGLRLRGAALVLAVVVLILAWKAYSSGWLHGQGPVGAPFEVEHLECSPDAPYPTTAPEQVKWVLCQHRSAMVLFYSTRCRPCMVMDALVQMVKPDYRHRVVFIEVKYDDPANAGLLRWAKVGTIPASLFVSGSGEVRHVAGQMNQVNLRAELDRIAADDAD